MRTVANANPQVRRRRTALLGAAFVGPIDGIGTPVAAYSLRRLLSSYVANKAVRIRRASDAVEQDFGFMPSGAFDVAGAQTFIGASSGTIVTIYDQSGNGNDLTQTLAPNQPNFTSASALISNNPTMSFVRASAHKLFLASIANLNQPYTLMAVAARTGSTASFSTIFGVSAGGNPVLDYNSSVNTLRFTAGASITLAGVSDNVAHCLGASVNAAASRWCLDGAPSAFSATPGAGLISSLALGTEGGNSLDGIIAEAIAFNTALSDGNMQSVQANQKAFYGTP